MSIVPRQRRLTVRGPSDVESMVSTCTRIARSARCRDDLDVHDLETTRLRAERPRPEHLEPLRALLQDARVARTLGEVPDDAAVETILDRHIDHWQREGFGYWMWFDRATGSAVGRGGLSRTVVGGRFEVEVGWAVAPELWGKGLATEMGGASAGLAFQALGVGEVVAYTLPDNLASRRVMEKLGFAYEHSVQHAGLPHVLYRLRGASS